MRQPSRHATVTAASSHPPLLRPRLRLAEDSPDALPVGVDYDSEDYAMLNQPIETERHLRRVLRGLRPLRQHRLLEVGSGRGWLAQRVQELVPETWATDVNPRAIAHGVANNMACMDACSLRFEDGQFEGVFSFHAIEHIPDAEQAIREMGRVVVPGGRIVLVYPAEPIRGLFAMPGAWLGFGNPFLARRLHIHRFTPRRIRNIAERVGLVHVTSRLDLLLTPQFVTVLKRPRGSLP